MAKYRKKPVVIDATQWFINYDHAMVVPYRNDDRERSCEQCRRLLHVHGWIETLEGGFIVCPGDWIITGVAGEHYPCKDDIFRETYEPVNVLTSVKGSGAIIIGSATGTGIDVSYVTTEESEGERKVE